MLPQINFPIIHAEQYRLTDALRSHQAWILQFQEMVGVDDRDAWDEIRKEMVNDTQCDFGKWLAKMGEDPEIAAFPCYGNINNIHRNMHEELIRIAEMIRIEKRILTQSDLTDLREHSHQMVSQMDQMDTRMFEREQAQEQEIMSGRECDLE